MNEFESVRRVYAEPAADPAARQRARTRLDAAIANESRPHRRNGHLRLLAAAASFALVLAVVVAALLVTPLGGTSAGATELRRLARLASSSPAIALQEGQYSLGRLQEVRIERRGDLESVDAFSVSSRLEIDTWIAPDGSGARRTEVLSSGFATPADRAAWVEAGRPRVPTTGEVRVERFLVTDTPWLDLTTLPTDPDRLIDVLHSGAMIPWPTDADEAFAVLGSLLAQGNASPELRSALLEVAARLEGVQLIGDATDPLGRTGISLALDGTDARTQLVFDPATSQLLAIERYPVTAERSVGELASWRAFEPTTISDTAP